MERKIGEIFEYNGEWYQCLEDSLDSCVNCCFYNGGHKKCSDKIGECFKGHRSDNHGVYFKKLEKVGEPFTSRGRLYQPYKVFNIDNVCGYDFWCVPNYKAKTLAIEIKQTKEDMEENKLNLKPFDIQKAREGKPVCTRDGRKARILCYDFKQNEEYPILVAVENKDGKECALLYSNDGISEMYKSSNNELAILPEKKEGWVNVYKVGARLETGGNVHSTKDAAIKCIDSDKKHIATVKIEWEK